MGYFRVTVSFKDKAKNFSRTILASSVYHAADYMTLLHSHEPGFVECNARVAQCK